MASAWKRVELFAYNESRFVSPGDLPQVGACYAIYLDGKLGYVGQTNNLCKRMVGHGFDIAGYSNYVTTAWGKYRSVCVKYRQSRKYGDWAMVELRLIRRLQPQFNQVGLRKRKAVAA